MNAQTTILYNEFENHTNTIYHIYRGNKLIFSNMSKYIYI